MSDPVNDAERLRADFFGPDLKDNGDTEVYAIKDHVTPIGETFGIIYTIKQDGKEEKYIHEFDPKNRPVFAVSTDGSALYILAGEYTFTDRGIVNT